MATKNLSKSQSAAPQKSKNFEISEAVDKLVTINLHLSGIDSLLANLEEGDNWAHAISYCIQGIKMEIEEVAEDLHKLAKGRMSGRVLPFEITRRTRRPLCERLWRRKR